MLRWLISKRLDAAEKKLGVPVDYMRHIARVSLPAFFKFIKIMPLAEYRRKLPTEAFHVARLVAVRHEDCGTCVQIEVNLAKQSGVSSGILKAVLASDLNNLGGMLAKVYRFAEAVVSLSGEEEALREDLRQEYGEEAIVELAMAIAVCRIFPTTKRALGLTLHCQS
jgi:alkylhydroperoxidase family enzyme